LFRSYYNKQKLHGTHIALQNNNNIYTQFFNEIKQSQIKNQNMSMARKYHTGSYLVSVIIASKCMTHGMLHLMYYFIVMVPYYDQSADGFKPASYAGIFHIFCLRYFCTI
jgi:riboflavin transporter FmnP